MLAKVLPDGTEVRFFSFNMDFLLSGNKLDELVVVLIVFEDYLK